MPTTKRDVKPWTATDYYIFAACFIPAAIVTWGIHEFGHWLMGRALGYDMWISFNHVGLKEGTYNSDLHQILVGIAGPIVTWFQAIVALYLVRRTGQLWSYSFLFLAFWLRTVAMGISMISKPNDEVGVSLLLGLPIWIVPAVSVAFLFTLLYLGNRILHVGWKGNLIAYVMASIVSIVVVFSDELLFFTN